MDPFKAALKFLGVTESSLWAKEDLKRVQQQAESLLEHYTIEGKDADAKKVLKALFVIKQTLKDKKKSEEKKDDIFGSSAGSKRPPPETDKGKMVGPEKKPRMSERSATITIGNSLTCCSCNQSYNADNFAISCPGQFLCPRCRFLAMDPFNPAVDGKSGILKLVFVEDAKFKFKIDTPKLQKWRKRGYSIEARMCCLDSSKAKQVWPKSLSCEINRHKAFEIKAPEPGHGRRDLPHNVSAFIRVGENQVRVKLEDDHVTNFVFALIVTSPQTVEQLSSNVAREDKTQCQRRVRDVLSTTASNAFGLNQEIECLSSNRIRLQCPITFVRIQTPVRGWKCQHLQCFDLEGYLISNRRMKAINNRWSCPVCNIALKPPADLCIDMYFKEILTNAAGEKNEDEGSCYVEFQANGEWRQGFDERIPGDEGSSPGTPPAEDLEQPLKGLCSTKDASDQVGSAGLSSSEGIPNRPKVSAEVLSD